ncbi:MAG: SEL1-like repeat protein [Atopobiaceae bacterium]|nr:SEL1-like repeat protein [Atopobiaceae bacterium]
MTSMPGCQGKTGCNAPIYAFGFDGVFDGWAYTDAAGLPDVCTSIPVDEPMPGRTGRLCKGCYRPSIDPDGEMALFCGSQFYDEGLGYVDEADHARRIDCFRAAELLYLHAAAKGQPYAFLNLGYVYSYDRCEGDYWGHWDDLVYEENWVDESGRYHHGSRYARYYSEDLPPYPCNERAVECFRTAAEAGVAEACYKLGDLLRDGRGCKMSLDDAFHWFRRAWELGQDEEPVVWGSAALRLGNAYEEGEGCAQSFAAALVWYERATTGLFIAVSDGDLWYRSALRRAEAGFARARQELDGRY